MLYRTVTIGLLLFGLLLAACPPAQGVDRPPAVAGSFYPADSTELATMVRGHLAQVTDLPEIDGDLVALIVPHAGLVYSGAIAAQCYKLLEGSKTNRVILVGPSHRYPFEGASVYGSQVRWVTPLGSVSCDDELCNALVEQDGVGRISAAHEREHSLEVQLPYLQAVLSDFSIVPIVIGRQSKDGIDGLSNALKSLEYDDRTILVASTDWQHYKPVAVGAPMDSLGVACLLDLDPDRLARLLATEEVQMCGGGAAVAVTRAAVARGADRAVLLRYGHSGEVSGDNSSVVGYAAIALYKHVDRAAQSPPDGIDQKEAVVKDNEPYQLSDSDKQQLLEIARLSIAGYLDNGDLPTFDVTGILADPGGAFVTLEKEDQLRGCIGYTQAVKPLYRTVSECAVKAATQDNRFDPVKPDELIDLHIEISVLTPLEKIESLDEIEVGRDGLMIALGNRRGLLLPQVAVENGWDRTTFLEKTCWKAGLPENAYMSPDAVIYKYQALIFGE